MIFNSAVQGTGGGAEMVTGVLRGSRGTEVYFFDGESVQRKAFTNVSSAWTVTVPLYSPVSPFNGTINSGAVECGPGCAVITEDGFDIQVS